MNSTSSKTNVITEEQARTALAQAFQGMALDGRRVLVIIPDSTRTAPTPLMFRLIYEQIGRRVARLDYLIALGTHPPMTKGAISQLVGVTGEQRAELYPNVEIYNHHWDDPQALETIGVISRAEAEELTGGCVTEDIPVRLNRMILDYDQLVICGPVFPHEVAGFSGGAKYFFPGIAGADIINATHWLSALVSNLKTIGIKDTPTRRVIHRAARFVPRPVLCIAEVMQGQELHGLFVGEMVEAWSAAADLSAELNIVTVPHAFKRVLSMPSGMYDELWTAGKAMYKTEPAIADGGEVIIYAPHLAEISVTHGRLIEAVGYHVKDYFLKQPDKFKDVPGTIKAHSTHVKGAGVFDLETGVETPRIQVTLATGMPEEVCRRINLGYMDHREIHPEEWEGREAEGVLVVHHAGEVLYRARDLN